MNKHRKTMISVFLILSSFLLGTGSAFAYELWSSGGFTPIPTTIHAYGDFTAESKNAVSYACSAWNGA